MDEDELDDGTSIEAEEPAEEINDDEVIYLEDLPSLVEQRWLEVRDTFTRWRKAAQINEAFVHGRQHALNDNNVDLFAVAGARYDYEDSLSVNVVGGLMTSWSALITKDRQAVKAVPGNPDDPIDEFRAETANRFIRHFVRENDTAHLFARVMQRVFDAGVAGVKVFHSVEEDRIKFEQATIHDFFCDTQSGQAPKWIVFETLITREEAEDEIEASGIEESSVEDAKSQYTVFGDENKGILRREIWELPSRSRPEGLFGVVIGGTPVYLSAYPESYSILQDSGQRMAVLPICLTRMRDIRGSVFGGTTLSSAIPVQRALNRAYSRMDDWVDQMRQMLVLPRHMKETFRPDEDSVIWSDTGRDTRETIFYVNPQEVPRTMKEHAADLEKKIYDIIGVNEVSASNEVRSLSGVAIRNMRELDIQKNADASKSIEVMVKNAFRLALSLVGYHYSPERIVKISGGDLWTAEAFRRAEVDGSDIMLEPSTEISMMQDAQRQEAAEGVAAGTITPEEASRRIDPGSAQEQQVAESMVEQYIAGENVDVDPARINPGALMFVARREMAKAQDEGRREDWMALRALMVQLRSLAAQAGEQMPEADPDAEQPQLSEENQPGLIPGDEVIQ